MKPTFQQHNDFLDLKPIPGVALQHNDFVMVVGGEHIGDSGSIVSVENLADDPTYLVELEKFRGDALIRQSDLQFVEHDR
jgi:ribosomal protein S4E